MLSALLIGVDEKGHKLLCWNWFFVCFPWSSLSWCHWSRLILFMLKIYFESFSRYVQPCFINALPCFDRFSLIQARNWASMTFLGILFFGESTIKISKLFLTSSTCPACPAYFTPHPSSKLSVVAFVVLLSVGLPHWTLRGVGHGLIWHRSFLDSILLIL